MTDKAKPQRVLCAASGNGRLLCARRVLTRKLSAAQQDSDSHSDAKWPGDKLNYVRPMRRVEDRKNPEQD